MSGKCLTCNKKMGKDFNACSTCKRKKRLRAKASSRGLPINTYVEMKK